mmetsp:Transcript_51937/g.123644  ORF Transcript_51937/g.123644 Transcript_51937/m.123644 type:complete len:844 (+) Transcript_51937:47-2578(+)
MSAWERTLPCAMMVEKNLHSCLWWFTLLACVVGHVQESDAAVAAAVSCEETAPALAMIQRKASALADADLFADSLSQMRKEELQAQLHLPEAFPVPPDPNQNCTDYYLCSDSLSESRIPDASKDGIDAVKNWTQQFIAQGERKFTESSRKRAPSPKDWADVIVYHVLVDRFNNGDLNNDHLNLEDWEFAAKNRNDLDFIADWRHGGDIQGVRDRLDYMVDLGVSALWITPLHKANGYHGYCTTDPTAIDPGFGTAEEFVSLVQECHDRGIRVVLDLAVNHLCDNYTHYEESPDLFKCADFLNESHWSDDSGESDLRGKLSFSQTFFPAFRSQNFFNRCGPLPDFEMRHWSATTIYGDFKPGFYDFNTRDYDWQEIYTNIMKFWIAYADVDGFRLDAAKHTTEDFLAYFSTELRKYAQSLGKENFFIIGEIGFSTPDWQARATGKMMSDPKDPDQHGPVPATLTRRLKEIQSTYLANPVFPMPGLNAVYNFRQAGTATATMLAQNRASDLKKYFEGEKYPLLMDSLPHPDNELEFADKELWTCLELHDWSRFLFARPHSPSNAVIGLVWLMTSVGTPVIYAGLEQGFNGKCPEDFAAAGSEAQVIVKRACQNSDFVNDGPKRQDHFVGGPWRLGSAIQAVNRLSYVGPPKPKISPPWREDPYLNREHVIYLTARRVVHLRRSCPELVHGKIRWHATEDPPGKPAGGLYVFSRSLQNTSLGHGVEFMVVINSNDQNVVELKRFELDSNINRVPGAKWQNIFNPSQQAEVEIIKGKPYLNFKGLQANKWSTFVFTNKENLLPYNKTLGASMCVPHEHPRSHMFAFEGAEEWPDHYRPHNTIRWTND